MNNITLSEKERARLEQKVIALGCLNEADVPFVSDAKLFQCLKRTSKKDSSPVRPAISSISSSLLKNKFPDIDGVGDFENYFCKHFLVLEQQLLKHKLIKNLLSINNKIADQLNRSAQLLNEHILPLSKLNCFDEDDRKYLGVHSEAILGGNSHNNTVSGKNSNNPVFEIFEIQCDVVSKLQLIVSNREKTLQDESVHLEEFQIEFFQKKQQVLIDLLKVEDEKLAFLQYVLSSNTIQDQLFIEASALLENKSSHLSVNVTHD